jgi:hypothetical protein
LILHSTQWLEPLVLDKVIILTIGIVVLHWTFMLTIGISAFVVMVMKGPAYVADPYYPPDFNEVDDEISFRDI